MECIDHFIRLAYAAGRPDVGWWMVGAILQSAAQLRATLAIPQSQWDVEYGRLVTTYQAADQTGPNAVLLGTQARMLLKQALDQSPTPSGQYMAALLDQWMQAIQTAAPSLSLAPLARGKQTIPTWAYAVGLGVVGLGVKWLLGGSDDDDCDNDQQVVIVQLGGE